ncbi:MAG: NAD+ synthase [Candidatus Electryonea clarkiae]|nr:NAD+ synthase [Candidatus Electryonea clarkiae]MDP8287534.1 NAD+ synthase [Candidatus Electryonea clarkiae]
MKIVLAQLNPTVGDVRNNLAKLITTIENVPVNSADLLVTPELYLCGYPPKDLLSFPWFIDQLSDAVEELKQFSKTRPDIGILVGTVRNNGRTSGKGLCNSAVLVSEGEIRFARDKQLLPTYDVFDEDRYFDEGDSCEIFEFHNTKLGISICEDAWNDPEFENSLKYDFNPIELLARRGAEVFINLSASPYHLGKESNRYHRFVFHAQKWSKPFIFVGQVGANDDLIFDGLSMAFDAEGRLIKSLPLFKEKSIIINTDLPSENGSLPTISKIDSLRMALVLGIKDYMKKTGFNAAVLGLSGGIDSALVACLAVDALGKENVRCITMPSIYSSSGSVEDSLILAKNLGIRCDRIPIKGIFDCYNDALKESFDGFDDDVTEENLQARIRGTLLMAYSNKFGSILLTTGNKSEMAVGYCTLYGDMNGGLAVISDLPKLMVYELARWYNRNKELIPESILLKASSAELRPDQEDQDTLPPYEQLDDILELYLEEFKSGTEMVNAGHDPQLVQWVTRAVDINEYKRNQAPLGLRVTSKAFGSGRRMPIAGKWKDDR